MSICEKCGQEFDYPMEGGQPESGDYTGVPICGFCFCAEKLELESDE